MKLTLETNRLLLRPFREEDAEAMFYGWASDPEVTRYLTWNTHENIETTKYVLGEWLKEYEQPERLNFAIELKSTGQLIGGIDVVGYDNGVPVIGYNLAKKYWNCGYMTEACRRVLEYLFAAGYQTVKIDAMTDNIGSNRVIQKCGGVLFKTKTTTRPLKQDTVTVNCYLITPNANEKP